MFPYIRVSLDADDVYDFQIYFLNVNIFNYKKNFNNKTIDNVLKSNFN